jgi:hypothetical protein
MVRKNLKKKVNCDFMINNRLAKTENNFPFTPDINYKSVEICQKKFN